MGGPVAEGDRGGKLAATAPPPHVRPMAQMNHTAGRPRAEARRPERDRRARRAVQRNMPAQKSDALGKAAALLAFPAGDRPGWRGGRKQ